MILITLCAHGWIGTLTRGKGKEAAFAYIRK